MTPQTIKEYLFHDTSLTLGESDMSTVLILYVFDLDTLTTSTFCRRWFGRRRDAVVYIVDEMGIVLLAIWNVGIYKFKCCFKCCCYGISCLTNLRCINDVNSFWVMKERKRDADGPFSPLLGFQGDDDCQDNMHDYFLVFYPLFMIHFYHHTSAGSHAC